MQSNLFVISGPSGAGEDSIINGLRQKFSIEIVTTTTTRPMREGESEGNPYYFIDKADFQAGIKENRFFEYACQYNNHFYGVTNQEIDRVKNSGKVGIWKIEYQGVIQAKRKIPDVIAILITAPFEQLENRLKKRGGMSEAVIKERMEYTQKFLENRHIYDYEVVNRDGELDKSIEKTANIIKKHTELPLNSQS